MNIDKKKLLSIIINILIFGAIIFILIFLFSGAEGHDWSYVIRKILRSLF